MAKQKGKANAEFRNKLNQIQKITQEMEKERKKVVVECSHQNEKGKLKIRVVNEQGEYQCQYCEARFNMNPIKEHALKDATKTVHDAIQQIRCFSDIDEDAKMIRLLGELDFNLLEVGEMYRRVNGVYGKGNGKKDKRKNRGDQNEFGAYGAGNLSFMGGGGGRR